MAFTPIMDRIVVRRNEKENKTPNGIILPDDGKELPSMGVVISMGPNIKEDIKSEDTVIFGKYAGNDVEINGEKLLVIRESDVLAVIPK